MVILQDQNLRLYIFGILYMNTIQPGQKHHENEIRLQDNIRRAQNLASIVRNYYYGNLKKSIWEKSFITDLPYGIYTPIRSSFLKGKDSM